MNRRNFFQTIVAIIVAFFAKASAKVTRTKPARSTQRAVWVVFSHTKKSGNMFCPFCEGIMGTVKEGGLYPTTMYCGWCKIGFNKLDEVRNYWNGESWTGKSDIEVEYAYES